MRASQLASCLRISDRRRESKTPPAALTPKREGCFSDHLLFKRVDIRAWLATQKQEFPSPRTQLEDKKTLRLALASSRFSQQRFLLLRRHEVWTTMGSGDYPPAEKPKSRQVVGRASEW